jgi:hypothetical protein
VAATARDRVDKVRSRNARHSYLFTALVRRSSDAMLRLCGYLGLAGSVTVVHGAGARLPVLLVLWILYGSFVHVRVRAFPVARGVALTSERRALQAGQLWFEGGWERQLTETGFLALFLCPLWGSAVSVSKHLPPQLIPRLVLVWQLFRYERASVTSVSRWPLTAGPLTRRVVFGAGLAKLRSPDSCYRTFSCLEFIIQSQPLPTPGAWCDERKACARRGARLVSIPVAQVRIPAAERPYSSCERGIAGSRHCLCLVRCAVAAPCTPSCLRRGLLVPDRRIRHASAAAIALQQAVSALVFNSAFEHWCAQPLFASARMPLIASAG